MCSLKGDSELNVTPKSSNEYVRFNKQLFNLYSIRISVCIRDNVIDEHLLTLRFFPVLIHQPQTLSKSVCKLVTSKAESMFL